MFDLGQVHLDLSVWKSSPCVDSSAGLAIQMAQIKESHFKSWEEDISNPAEWQIWPMTMRLSSRHIIHLFPQVFCRDAFFIPTPQLCWDLTRLTATFTSSMLKNRAGCHLLKKFQKVHVSEDSKGYLSHTQDSFDIFNFDHILSDVIVIQCIFNSL